MSKHQVENLDPIRRNIELMTLRQPGAPDDVSIQNLTVAGVPAQWIDAPEANPNKVLLYLHGGGYIIGSVESTHKDLVWRLSAAGECRVLGLNYRLAPEGPYPAAVDDAIAAYQWLLVQGYAPESIAIAGDSAGGGLTFGTALRLRDEGIPLPAALVGLSPWTDLAITGESIVSNARAEAMLPPDRVGEVAELYLNGADPRTPHSSPLYGEQEGLPPTLIHVGSREILRDDAIRLAEKIKAAGVPVVLEVWPNMPHVWQVFARHIPEARQAIAHIGMFLQGHLRSKPVSQQQLPTEKPALLEID
ncbi:MAG: alpha/beta hydrolase [Pseudomonadota bacterium]